MIAPFVRLEIAAIGFLQIVLKYDQWTLEEVLKNWPYSRLIAPVAQWIE
jgi:hypothetical protein